MAATHFVFPSSANAQGYAFEGLLHRILPQMGFNIQQPSGWYHFDKWYQLDGIVSHNDLLWLLEAKFTQAPLTSQNVDLTRRIEAMHAAGAQGVLYASINPVTDQLYRAHEDLNVAVFNLTWNELESALPEVPGAYQTCLLDPVVYDLSHGSFTARARTLLSDLAKHPVSHPFLPNVLVLPDEVELWVRRLPRILDYEQAIAPGTYEVSGNFLKPVTRFHLSLAEAWQIQDSLSGYSYRVLNAIEQTLLALASIGSGDAQEVQSALPAGVTTGVAGVRSSLSNMLLWKLAQRKVVERRSIYAISPLGYALVAKGQLDRKFLAELLEAWMPYSYFKRFLEMGYYQLNPVDIVQWFRQQYEPFYPYAKSLFNPNKVDGLVHTYRNLS